MSAEDLEKYETEMELQLYREYRDVVGLFTHVVETERRFYLTNDVDLNVRTADNGEVFFLIPGRTFIGEWASASGRPTTAVYCDRSRGRVAAPNQPFAAQKLDCRVGRIR